MRWGKAADAPGVVGGAFVHVDRTGLVAAQGGSPDPDVATGGSQRGAEAVAALAVRECQRVHLGRPPREVVAPGMGEDGATAVVGAGCTDQDPPLGGREGRPLVGVGLGGRVEGADLFPTSLHHAEMIDAASVLETLEVARGGGPPGCADQCPMGSRKNRGAESVPGHAVGGLEGGALDPLAGSVALEGVDRAGDLRRLGFVALSCLGVGCRARSAHEQPIARCRQHQAEVGPTIAVLPASRVEAIDTVAFDRARRLPGSTVRGALEDVQRAVALSDKEGVAVLRQHGSEAVGPLGVRGAQKDGFPPLAVRLLVDIDGAGAEVGVGFGDEDLVAVDHDRVAEGRGLGREGWGGRGEDRGQREEGRGRLASHDRAPVSGALLSFMPLSGEGPRSAVGCSSCRSGGCGYRFTGRGPARQTSSWIHGRAP